ncbi:MAG: sel1 repeat family protein [Oscillibacter sp.]|nr:sel1 repeat family protein [Oscillibacter sp.]
MARGKFQRSRVYFDGLGVEKNYIQALSLFRQAAEQDNAQALCMLGKCYESGNGVVKDMAQALQYYHQAAELGDADAQTCLGRCYMYGKGVPKNLRTAKDWLQMASNDGDELTHFLLAETYYALYIRDELGIDAMTIAKVIPFVNFGAFAIDGISRLGDADKTRTFLRTEEGAEMIRHYKIAAELGHEGAKKKLEMFRAYGV